MEQRPVWAVLQKRWVEVAVIVFAAQILLFYLVVSLPISTSEAQSLSGSYSSVQSSLHSTDLFGRAILIFTNNVRIALMEVVPVLGAALFGLSTYETSRTLEAVALIQPGAVANLPPQILVTLLFLFPHSWLELPAYAVAFTESMYLIYAVLKHDIMNELKRAMAVVFFVIILLFVAAMFESAEITYPVYALALWAPAIGVFFGAYIFLKRFYRSDGIPVGGGTTADAHETPTAPV